MDVCSSGHDFCGTLAEEQSCPQVEVLAKVIWMQVAQGQGLAKACALVQLQLVAASCSYILVPKMVLTLALQLALVVFFLYPLAHLLMCTHAHEHILQLALCGPCLLSACVAPWCTCYSTVDNSIDSYVCGVHVRVSFRCYRWIQNFPLHIMMGSLHL